MKKQKNKAAQALAKLRHEKSPKDREFYKRISDLGAEGRARYWRERREKKELEMEKEN